MNKESFFTHLRQQLPKAQLPQAASERPEPLILADFDPAELVESFVTELTAVNGVVHQATDGSEAVQLLITLLEQVEAQQFLSWDNSFLPLSQLNEQLQQQGYQRLKSHLPHTAAEREAAQQALAAAPIGITGALAALADTGSLVLQCGNGRGRHASLLPHTHVALLQVAQLMPSMHHLIRHYPTILQETSNLIFVTGPSRTADIEQTLTLGVHGPKELHVILLP